MILAIDPSSVDTEVGWALMDRSNIHYHGTGVSPAITELTNAIRSGDFIEAIVVENQYFNDHFSSSGAQSVITLAHHAGRWLQVGADYAIPVIFVAPLDWMHNVIGHCLKKGTLKSRLCQAAITARYTTLIKNEHAVDAICIGISYLNRHFKGVKNVESEVLPKKSQSWRKNCRGSYSRKPHAPTDSGKRRSKRQTSKRSGQSSNET